MIMDSLNVVIELLEISQLEDPVDKHYIVTIYLLFSHQFQWERADLALSEGQTL